MKRKKPLTLREITDLVFRKALKRHDNNVLAAANELGVGGDRQEKLQTIPLTTLEVLTTCIFGFSTTALRLGCEESTQ